MAALAWLCRKVCAASESRGAVAIFSPGNYCAVFASRGKSHLVRSLAFGEIPLGGSPPRDRPGRHAICRPRASGRGLGSDSADVWSEQVGCEILRGCPLVRLLLLRGW
jgi:hypothetical protein